MIAGTAKKRYPVREEYRRFTQPMRDNLLNFHALTVCITSPAFSDHGKKNGLEVQLPTRDALELHTQIWLQEPQLPPRFGIRMQSLTAVWTRHSP